MRDVDDLDSDDDGDDMPEPIKKPCPRVWVRYSQPPKSQLRATCRPLQMPLTKQTFCDWARRCMLLDWVQRYCSSSVHHHNLNTSISKLGLGHSKMRISLSSNADAQQRVSCYRIGWNRRAVWLGQVDEDDDHDDDLSEYQELVRLTVSDRNPGVPIVRANGVARSDSHSDILVRLTEVLWLINCRMAQWTIPSDLRSFWTNEALGYGQESATSLTCATGPFGVHVKAVRVTWGMLRASTRLMDDIVRMVVEYWDAGPRCIVPVASRVCVCAYFHGCQ